MANKTNTNQAPKLGLGASVLTALSGGLAGIGRGSLGASAQAGSQKAQQAISRNQQQFDRQQAYARQEGQDARQSRLDTDRQTDRERAYARQGRQDERQGRQDARLVESDKRAEQSHQAGLENEALKREAFRQAQFNKITDAGNTRYRNNIVSSSGPRINAQSGASGGQLKYISQKKRKANATYARYGEHSAQLDSMEGFYNASLSPDPATAKIGKENLAIFAKQKGWEITGNTTKDGAPIFKPPGMPYMSGDADSLANLRAKFKEGDDQAYTSMISANQSSYTGPGGNLTYMQKKLGQDPKFSRTAVLNGSNEYAQTMQSKPYWAEMSGFINLSNDFTKDEAPSEFIETKMIAELQDRDIRYTLDEKGKPLANLNDINESFNEFLPDGQKVDLFDTGGEMVYAPVDKKMLQQMRDRSGMQGEADKIFDKYNTLTDVDNNNQQNEFRRELDFKNTLAKEAKTNASKTVIDRMKAGKIHNGDSIQDIATATGLDQSEILDAKLAGGSQYLEQVSGVDMAKLNADYAYSMGVDIEQVDLFEDLSASSETSKNTDADQERAKLFMKDRKDKSQFNKKDFEGFQTKSIRDFVNGPKDKPKSKTKGKTKPVDDFFGAYGIDKLDKARADSKKTSPSKFKFTPKGAGF